MKGWSKKFGDNSDPKGIPRPERLPEHPNIQLGTFIHFKEA
ncbi:hypothetical protein [Paenibacillus sp. FSL R7-0272]